MESSISGPVTRSRRNVLCEKEKEVVPSLTENDEIKSQTESSAVEKTDSSDKVEAVKEIKQIKEMDEISSPVRVTRGRKSLTTLTEVKDSPSRNLRKRAVSPESKATPKKTSPKKDDKAEMTPGKRNLRINLSLLATVDSPKPRKSRISSTENLVPVEAQKLRRSRRLSTELNVLQEDPIREAEDESTPSTPVKSKSRKRLSVVVVKSPVIEEMEVDEIVEVQTVPTITEEDEPLLTNAQSEEDLITLQMVDSPINSPRKQTVENEMKEKEDIDQDFIKHTQPEEELETTEEKTKSLNDSTSKKRVSLNTSKDKSNLNSHIDVLESVSNDLVDLNEEKESTCNDSFNNKKRTSLNTSKNKDSLNYCIDVLEFINNELVDLNEEEESTCNDSFNNKKRTSLNTSKNKRKSNSFIDMLESVTNDLVDLNEEKEATSNDSFNKKRNSLNSSKNSRKSNSSALNVSKDKSNKTADNDTILVDLNETSNKSNRTLDATKINESLSNSNSLVKSFMEDSPKPNVSINSPTKSKRVPAKDVFMSEFESMDVESLMNSPKIKTERLNNSKGSKKKEKVVTSTPAVEKKHSRSSDKSDDLSNGGHTLLSDDSSDDNINVLVDTEAMEADPDYESGDSIDEGHLREMEDNEIIERGESLHSSSSEDCTDDDEYEKDSFLCSSDDEDEALLSGTGEDLSSGEELTQSRRSKEKFNKKQEELQKKASREMYNARHGLNDSKSKKRKRIMSSDDSDSEAEKEVINTSRNVSKKDSSMSKDKDSSIKDISMETKLNASAKSLSKEAKTEGTSDVSSPEKVQSKRSKIKERLNKSEIIQGSSKDASTKTLSSSFSIPARVQSDPATDRITKNMVLTVDRLSKVYKDLADNVHYLKSALDSNSQTEDKIEPLTTEENVEEAKTSGKKRKLSEYLEELTKLVDEEEASESQTSNKSEKAGNSKEAVKSSETKKVKLDVDANRKKQKLDSSMKVEDLDRSLLVSGFKVKAKKLPQSKKPRLISTSDFEVEDLSESKSVQCTNTAGSFSVSAYNKKSKVLNAGSGTTEFSVVSLKSVPKEALKVDRKFQSGYINFKQDLMFGQGIRREVSSNLLKNQQKMNAYRRN